MEYRLDIDENPYDNSGDTHKDFKAATESEAIIEAKNILNSGEFHPYHTDAYINEDLSITGRLSGDDGKEIVTIRVKFNDMSPKETIVE